MDRDYRDLRKEWDNGRERFRAYDSLTSCFNCGSSEGIELHHVVPLKLGGTNNLSNIVALCHRCHCAAHYGRHIRDYCNKSVSGRPHKVSSETLINAFDDFLSGKIGTKECKERIKMAKSSKIKDMSFFKNLLKERGIKDCKNNIDIIRRKRGLVRKGDIVGQIIYINGDVKNLYFEI